MLLDVRPDHLEVVRSILRKWVPTIEVWAFGSRAKWVAKDYSDLDLCLITQKPLDFAIMAHLEEDFSDSDLPYKVDLVDWATTSEAFRKIIEREKVVVQIMATEQESEITLEKFTDVLVAIVDNRGKTCPVGDVGLPLIATNCVNGVDLYPSYETTRFISDETYKTWFRGHPEPGDILFVCKGSPGRTNLVPDPVDFCIAQDMVSVRADPARVYPKYLFAALRSDFVQSQIANMHVGTMIPHFKKGDFDKLLIPRLGNEMEVGVGDFYFLLSERITLLRETNTTLEAIAQALFKSWFVDFDPVGAKMEGRAPEGMDEATAALFPDAFEETELGVVPKGWSYVPIGSVVEGIFDGPHATPPEAQDGPVFLGIKNLTGTALDLSEVRHISPQDWPQWTRRVTPQAEDIVFSYEATLGFFALVPPGLQCCLGRRLALIRPNRNNGSAHFWFHQLTAKPFQTLLEKHTIYGATVNRIALKEFPSYEVLNPSEAVRLAFEQVAAPLWGSIHANQAQAQTLSTLRDTLLPRLISGQLRLPQAQAELEAVA